MNILNENYVIISVMGPHAGESSEEIFSRKIDDVENIGKTFWVVQSYKANPPKVKSLIQKAESEKKDVFCIFISPSQKGGAKPTTLSDKARYFSSDKKKWEELPSGLSPVTGKMSSNSFSLVFDKLWAIDETTKLDLWNYADFEEQEKPVLPKLGVSTICTIKKDMSMNPKKIKSNLRNIEAIARVSALGCVWLK